MEYPKIVQVEVTNKCNFNCIMCIRSTWSVKTGNMDFKLFRKIARESFQYSEKIDLYGMGEPLLHPDLLRMVRLAKECSRDAEIFISTNGSLLSPEIAIKLFEAGLTSVSFSIDSSDLSQLAKIRRGAEPSIILRNLKSTAAMKNKYSAEVGIEFVAFKDNYRDIPGIVEMAGKLELDYVVVSNVIPYTKEFYEMAVYLTLSSKPFKVARSAPEYGWDLIRLPSYKLLSEVYGRSINTEIERVRNGFWSEAAKYGYWVNLPLLIESKERIKLAEDTLRYVEKASRIASQYGIRFEQPKLIPDSKDRECPYVVEEATVVRADGAVAPCFEFLYTHPLFVNNHQKIVKAVNFGNVRQKSILDIWNSDEYVEFRDARRRLSTTTPWCGDCPYSSLGCWFVKDNSLDCYGNSPSCSECLYSVGISKCQI